MFRLVAALTLLVLVFTAGCSKEPEVNPAHLQMYAPLPDVMESKANPLTPEKIDLGRMLYYETRLSKSQQFSCNSCHMLDKFGVDNEPTSEGHKNQRGDRNSPTTYNAASHFVQFWDGRAATVEEQAKGPVLNPVEMAMPDEKYVLRVLNSIPGYVEAFKKAYPDQKDPVTYDNMANAIGAFERKLVTPARWDQFLKGDKTALTPEEKAGFNKFVDAGCAACHMGAYAGGTLYQKLGVVKPWPDKTDLGRAKVTKNQGDEMMFKVPSLRNIEKTGPYFHDGKVATLEEAIKLMAEYELGKQLVDADVKSIAAWLRSLTGTIPADYIKPPALPPSGPKTPKPDLT